MGSMQVNIGTVRPMHSTWVIIYRSSSRPRRTEMAVDGARQCVTTEGCYNHSLLHSGKLEYADAPCMKYLPTFATKINQMQVDVSLDPMGQPGRIHQFFRVFNRKDWGFLAGELLVYQRVHQPSDGNLFTQPYKSKSHVVLEQQKQRLFSVQIQPPFFFFLNCLRSPC